MPAWNRADFERFYSFHGEPWGRPNTRPAIRLHYHNWSVGQHQRTKYAQMLAQLLAIQPGDSVVIVGCGFNWTGRGLADLGADVIGVDTSVYIMANEAETEEGEIRSCIGRVGLDADTAVVPSDGLTARLGIAGRLLLDVYLEGGIAAPRRRGWGAIVSEDLTAKRGRNQVARLLASNPRYIITEETLNSISDAEALALCDGCAQFASERSGTVIHMLSPRQDEAQQEPDLNWKPYAEWRALLDANGFQAQLILPTVTYGSIEQYEGLI